MTLNLFFQVFIVFSELLLNYEFSKLKNFDSICQKIYNLHISFFYSTAVHKHRSRRFGIMGGHGLFSNVGHTV
jgi:hypothetical protein